VPCRVELKAPEVFGLHKPFLLFRVNIAVRKVHLWIGGSGLRPGFYCRDADIVILVAKNDMPAVIGPSQLIRLIE
jgi:hypothetical protein